MKKKKKGKGLYKINFKNITILLYYFSKEKGLKIDTLFKQEYIYIYFLAQLIEFKSAIHSSSKKKKKVSHSCFVYLFSITFSKFDMQNLEKLYGKKKLIQNLTLD